MELSAPRPPTNTHTHTHTHTHTLIFWEIGHSNIWLKKFLKKSFSYISGNITFVVFS